MRPPKCEIYTPKRDDENPHPFHMRSPPAPSAPSAPGLKALHCVVFSFFFFKGLLGRKQVYYQIDGALLYDNYPTVSYIIQIFSTVTMRETEKRDGPKYLTLV